MAEAFLELEDEFIHIANTYADLDSDMAKKENYLNQAVV